MRKLLIIDTHPIDYHIDIFNEIHKRKIDLNIFFFKPSLANKSSFNRSLNNTFLGKSNHSTSIKKYIKVIFKVLEAESILIFGYNHFFCFYVSILCFLFQKQTIFKGEGNYHSGTKKNIFKKGYLKVFGFGIKMISYSYERNRIYLSDIFPRKKMFFFPSSVSCSRINDFKSKKSLFNSDENIIITFAGRFDSRKGIDIIVDYLKRIDFISFKKKFHFNFIGDGELRDELLNLSKLFQASNQISIEIFPILEQKELFQVIKNSNYLILPSKYDPSPKIILESFCLNTPVITTNDVGFAGDYLINGYNCLLYNSFKDFYLILKKISDEDMTIKLNKGIDETQSNWNLDLAIDNLLKFI